MKNPNQSIGRFFRIMISGQAYINLLYLLASFPLGLFYFVFLVSGLSTGISLLIIWVGFPILLLVIATWWAFAGFERLLVIYCLKEDIPKMDTSSNQSMDAWARFKAYFTNPVTWKSLVYLFLKFPLGIGTFVILATLTSLTLSFLLIPLNYEFMQTSKAGIFQISHLPFWTIDSIWDTLLLALIGVALWPMTLHNTNGLAWMQAKFARMMLSIVPMDNSPKIMETTSSRQ